MKGSLKGRKTTQGCIHQSTLVTYSLTYLSYLISCVGVGGGIWIKINKNRPTKNAFRGPTEVVPDFFAG